MKFRWLRDPLMRVLFENDEIVAIDKPYGFDTHTNESKVGQADFVQPGLIELFEKQLGHPLHIVHRLDRTTTGVLVFAKTESAAATYRDFFRERKTKKTYVFATRVSSPKSSASDRLSCKEPIVRNGSTLDASTDFVRLKDPPEGTTAKDRIEIWEAHPHTGRNHQIRIHAAHLGLALLGDEKYGGARFPFICLHNRRIEFPNGVVVEATAPAYDFKDPVRAHNLMEIDKRERLFHTKGQSLRLIHLPEEGLFLDQFGERRVLTWHHERGAPDLDALVRTKEMAKDHWVANEGSLKFQIRAEAGVGLFLDQRLQRQWVLENARGKSVLNLFAYTCGFSVAAVKGGAAVVTSVDTNKNMLNWGRENFALNDLDAAASVFLCRDAMQFLEQAKPVDLVICDPPNFSRGEKGIFKIEQQIEALLRGCLRVGREVLFSTNSETLFIDDLRKLILKLSPKAEITSLQPSLDFEALGTKASLKSFLIQQS